VSPHLAAPATHPEAQLQYLVQTKQNRAQHAQDAVHWTHHQVAASRKMVLKALAQPANVTKKKNIICCKQQQKSIGRIA